MLSGFRKQFLRFAKAASSVLLLSTSIVALSSCFSSVDASLKLQPTPILSRGPGWVVVKEAYARVKQKPSKDSSDIAHIRGGVVFEILAIALGDSSQGGPWYQITADGAVGWVQAADVDVLSTRAQADYTAARYR
jgi:hypothetical protein